MNQSPPEPWCRAASLAALHECRSQQQLDHALVQAFAEVAPGQPLVVGLATPEPHLLRAQVAIGGQAGVAPGGLFDAGMLPAAGWRRLQLRNRVHTVGEWFVPGDIAPDALAAVAAIATHYATALVNLTLNEESRKATDSYCLSLMALEEGIVLFQEEDPQAVMARLLRLATTMVDAAAGALYVLQEVGNPDSGLRLEQTLGMPEQVLQGFATTDGRPWPDCLFGLGTRLVQRQPGLPLAEIASDLLPSVLENVLILPLRYHGIQAGLCLLFNSAATAATEQEQLTRANSLGQLGAALLHRLCLEAQSARARSIQKELQIAEVIQRRLLPTKAPATAEYGFAWASVAAQSIGGDYLDLMTSDLGDIHAVIADASGHGINSALLMSSFRSTYRGEAPRHEPDELLSKLNREIADEVGSTGMFITATALRIERESRRLSVASAGHSPLLLLRSDGQDVAWLGAQGPPLGFAVDAEFNTTELTLAPGDVLVLFTDGITEATNANQEMFGEDRILAILRDHAAQTPDAILAALQAGLRRFTNRDRCDDDVSLLVIKAR